LSYIQNITDNIDTVLSGISASNGYNTDVQQVSKGIILETASYAELHRQALIQFRYAGQRNVREGAQTGNRAEVRFLMHASMMAVTHAEFANFLCDIDYALAQDPHRGYYSNTDNAYAFRDSYISNIEIIGGNDFDEVLGNSGKFKELLAIMELIVIVDYVPYLLL